MSATRIVSPGATASPRAVRTAGWSADQVAIPAVDAATRPEFSMKFRRFSSSLMGSSSGRACLEIRVEKNEPRSHLGSNGALHGKQERGGQADLVWSPLRLARSGPDHNMETDSARSAADSTRGRERNGRRTAKGPSSPAWVRGYPRGALAVALLACVIGLTGPSTARSESAMLDLSRAVVVTPEALTGPERKAVELLVEDVARRSGIRWKVLSRWPAEPVPVVARYSPS